MRKILKRFNFLWIFIGSLPVALFFVWVLRKNSVSEFSFLVFISLLYVTMALLHHVKDKTLTVEIMLEYILLAALGLIVLESLLL